VRWGIFFDGVKEFGTSWASSETGSREDYFYSAGASEEPSGEEVLLRPKTKAGTSGVVGRKVDVMDVDNDARGETG